MLGSEQRDREREWVARRIGNQGMASPILAQNQLAPFARERPPVTPRRRRRVGMLIAQPTPSGRSVKIFGERGFQYARWMSAMPESGSRTGRS